MAYFVRQPKEEHTTIFVQAHAHKMLVSKPPKGSFFPHDMQILPKFDERM
jgi:hypothetical protein